MNVHISPRSLKKGLRFCRLSPCVQGNDGTIARMEMNFCLWNFSVLLMEESYKINSSGSNNNNNKKNPKQTSNNQNPFKTQGYSQKIYSHRIVRMVAYVTGSVWVFASGALLIVHGVEGEPFKT